MAEMTMKDLARRMDLMAEQIEKAARPQSRASEVFVGERHWGEGSRGMPWNRDDALMSKLSKAYLND